MSYIADVFNSSSPDDQQCETLSLEFLSFYHYPSLYLKYIDIIQHFHAQIKDSF